MLQDAPLYVDSTHRVYINSLLCDVIYLGGSRPNEL